MKVFYGPIVSQNHLYNLLVITHLFLLSITQFLCIFGGMAIRKEVSVQRMHVTGIQALNNVFPVVFHLRYVLQAL